MCMYNMVACLVYGGMGLVLRRWHRVVQAMAQQSPNDMWRCILCGSFHSIPKVVYMCIYIYRYRYMYIYIYMYVYMYIYICICMCIHMGLYMYIYTYLYVLQQVTRYICIYNMIACLLWKLPYDTESCVLYSRGINLGFLVFVYLLNSQHKSQIQEQTVLN